MLLISALFAMLAGETTSAPPPRLEIVAHPNAQQLLRAFPAGPRKAGTGGQAKLQCVTKADFSVEGCSVVAEAPDGEGFGEAALAVAGYYKVKALDAEGRHVVGHTVKIPIVWTPMAR